MSQGISGGTGLALAAAFGWGLASILLSPCHLGSIPLIVGLISRRNKDRQGSPLILSLIFTVGILLSIALVGAVTAFLGRMLGDVGPYADYILAIVFMGFGLYLMDLVPLNWRGADLSAFDPRGGWGILGAGLVFGIALGPCTFAFLAPVLTVVFYSSTGHLLLSAGLLTSFAAGHCLLIVAAGTLTGKVQQYLDWAEGAKTLIYIKRFAGILIIAGGIYTLLG